MQLDWQSGPIVTVVGRLTTVGSGAPAAQMRVVLVLSNGPAERTSLSTATTDGNGHFEMATVKLPRPTTLWPSVQADEPMLALDVAYPNGQVLSGMGPKPLQVALGQGGVVTMDAGVGEAPAGKTDVALLTGIDNQFADTALTVSAIAPVLEEGETGFRDSGLSSVHAFLARQGVDLETVLGSSTTRIYIEIST